LYGEIGQAAKLRGRGKGGRDVYTSLSCIGKFLPKREIQNSKIK
jgi:hypothetical protein